MGLQLIKICPTVSTSPNINNFGGAVLAALSFVLTLSLSPQAAQGAVAMQQMRVGNSGADAHSKIIDVDFDHLPLDKALDIIAQKSGVSVSYRRDQVANVKPVTVHANRITIAEVFTRILAGTPYQLQASGAQLYLVERKQTKNTTRGTITGKITDAKTGKGISGATISLGTDTRGAMSDEDGTYRLAGIVAGTHTASVRLVGYAKQTRSVTVGEGATMTVDFKLEPSASVLDQVVVTGTIVSTELKAVPNAITVITAKQIEERGITRIDQLFRGDIPGLFALNQGSTATLDEVVMFSRGATNLITNNISTGVFNGGTDPIKTYIDGVEMADPQYLSQIDPSSIERIEILTGPQASTIYGSNAINGVMQIFTKRGIGNRPKLTLNLTSGVTENNFSSAVAPNHVTDAGITGAEGRISYNIGGSWNYIGSWTPGKQTQRLSAYGGGRAQISKATIDISARQGLTKTKQNGNLSQVQTQLRTSGIYSPTDFIGLPDPQTQTLNGRTFGTTLSYRPYTWWSHELVLGSDASATERMETAPGFGSTSGTDTALFITGSTTFRRSERYSSTIQVPVTSFSRANLTLGLDHWRTTGSFWSARPLSLTGTLSNVGNVTRNKPEKNRGVFAQGQLGLFDDLFFTYGVRADWNSSFGEDVRVTPGRYGVSYTRDVGSVSVKFRGSYGRSIRPPAPGLALATDCAVSIGMSSDFISQFGNFCFQGANSDLGPEHQSGGEGGIELYFGSRGSLVVTRFNQTVDNLISNVGPADSVRSSSSIDVPDPNFFCSSDFRDTEGRCFVYQYQYLNVGAIRNQGWEMQGSINIGPFTTNGTYSWVKSRVIGVTPKYRALLSGSTFEPGRSFDYVPEHTWALGATYSQSRNTVSLNVNGVGMRYIQFGALDLATSTNSRFHLSRPRMQTPLSQIYRPLGSGYATADLNATHRFSSQIDAILQVTNLTDYYQNDRNVQFASPGRSSRVGVRVRW